LQGEIKTPPFSSEARRSVGYLLRQLQEGAILSMPDSWPMPGIGPRCHELRIRDPEMRVIWRVIYRLDRDAIVIAAVFVKKTRQTPNNVIAACRRRLALYDAAGS
jgi:phage-related protein